MRNPVALSAILTLYLNPETEEYEEKKKKRQKWKMRKGIGTQP